MADHAPDEAPTCDAEGCTRPGIVREALFSVDPSKSWVRHWCLLHDPNDSTSTTP